MFSFTQERLEELGAEITTREIKQQPELWGEAYEYYQEHSAKIQEFLTKISEKHDHVRVIFTGAGTSAFVGETISPYLNEVNCHTPWSFEAIATTNIVSSPERYLAKDEPTLLVSFARSGNSPESVATVNIARKIVNDFYQMTITCAAEGKLAKAAEGDSDNLLLLMPPRSNDQGFAMTGSYTCMTLTALLVFDSASEEDKQQWVSQIRQMGEYVIEHEADIQSYVDLDFNRVVYLGSDGHTGLAREAQLKILELTAGQIATLYESPLGFRHGPKSFINEQTLVLLFASNHPYTRQYDDDLANEVYHDQIAKKTIMIAANQVRNNDVDHFQFDQDFSHIPDAYMALPFVIFGQTFAVMTALKVGNTPDTPSATGTVNRVVQGVIIHEY